MEALLSLSKILGGIPSSDLRNIARTLKIRGRSNMDEKELKSEILKILKDENQVFEILNNVPENALKLLDILRDHEGQVDRRVILQEYGMSYSTFRKYLEQLRNYGFVFYNFDEDYYFIPKEILKILNDFIREEEKSMSLGDFLNEYVSLEQLKDVCRDLNLKVSGRKGEIVERIVKSGIDARRILEAFSLSELKEIAEFMGLIKSGRKDDVINRIIEQLSISKVKRYTVSQEKEESKTERNTKKVTKDEALAEEIALFIEKNFTPLVYRKDQKEKDLEVQLWRDLTTAFGLKGHSVEYEKMGKRGRLDIVVDEKIGIELKYKPSKSDYQRLIGQIEDYLEEYSKIIVVLAVSSSSKPAVTNSYKAKLEAKGVKVIVKPV